MKVLGYELILKTKSEEDVIIPLPDGVHPEDLKVSGCIDSFDYRVIYDTSEAYEEEALVIEEMLEDIIQTYNDHDELIDSMREYISDISGVEDNDEAFKESPLVQKLLTRLIRISPKIFYSNNISLQLKREYIAFLNEDSVMGGFVGIFNDYNYSLAKKYYRRMWGM